MALTQSQIKRIIGLCKNQYSLRAIVKMTGHARKTVSKYVEAENRKQRQTPKIPRQPQKQKNNAPARPIFRTQKFVIF